MPRNYCMIIVEHCFLRDGQEFSGCQARLQLVAVISTSPILTEMIFVPVVSLDPVMSISYLRTRKMSPPCQYLQMQALNYPTIVEQREVELVDQKLN